MKQKNLSPTTNKLAPIIGLALAAASCMLLINAGFFVFDQVSDYPTSLDELTLFQGRIKSVVHKDKYRAKDESTIWLEDYDLDFILYHVLERKQDILSLERGQHVSIWARDKDVILDLNETHTYVVWQIESDEGAIVTLEDTLNDKKESRKRFNSVVCGGLLVLGLLILLPWPKRDTRDRANPKSALKISQGNS